MWDLYVLPAQPNRRSDRYTPLSTGMDALGNSRAAVAKALGPLVRDKWYWWRVKITWDERGKTLKAGNAGQTGALQIWRKGPVDPAPVLVVDRQHYAIGVGPIHNDDAGNLKSNINITNSYYLKYGIYAYSAEAIQPAGQRTFQILHDNVKIASGPGCETLLNP